MPAPKTLYQLFTMSGCTVDHHESDLYVKVDTVSVRMLADWRTDPTKQTPYSQFNADDGTGLWFEFPFEYEPFWNRAKA